MQKNHITLTDADRAELAALFSKGVLSVRTQKRGYALQFLDQGQTYQSVCDQLQVSYPTVFGWAASYRASGLSFLTDKARPGRPVLFSGEDRAKITALACSQPPEGRSHWSLRLLADKVVELELVETISYSEVGLILKKTNFSRTANANGVSGS